MRIEVESGCGFQSVTNLSIYYVFVMPLASCIVGERSNGINHQQAKNDVLLTILSLIANIFED